MSSERSGETRQPAIWPAAGECSVEILENPASYIFMYVLRRVTCGHTVNVPLQVMVECRRSEFEFRRMLENHKPPCTCRGGMLPAAPWVDAFWLACFGTTDEPSGGQEPERGHTEMAIDDAGLRHDQEPFDVDHVRKLPREQR